MANLYSFGTPFGDVNVAQDASEDFQGLIEELVRAGAPLKKIGSYNYRNIAGTNILSEHAKGRAVDVGNQQARDVVDPEFRQWVEENPERYSQILAKYNMRGGESFRNPDLGHIEWRGEGAGKPMHEAAPLGGAMPSNYDTEDRTAVGLGGSRAYAPEEEAVADATGRPRGILDMMGMPQQQQPGGLLGMLGDPETMSYIAMMLKGASPYSNLDPGAMLTNAHSVAMRKAALEQQRMERMTDNQRADRALSLREQEYGQARTERQERADAAFEERQQKRDLSGKQKEIDDEVRRNLGGGSREEGAVATVPEGTRSAEDQIAQLNRELAKNPSPHIAKSIERRIEQLQKQETDKAIPAELAGRLGMADVYLKKAPDIAKAIDAGDLTGPIDQPLARFGGALGGKSAEKYRDMQSGVDALTRMMTGAGMPASEAEAYASRYLPALTDDATSLRSKHDRLVEELQTIKRTVEKGRIKSPGAPPTEARTETKAPDLTQVKRGNDGKYYVPDPSRPGKYLMVEP